MWRLFSECLRKLLLASIVATGPALAHAQDDLDSDPGDSAIASDQATEFDAPAESTEVVDTQLDIDTKLAALDSYLDQIDEPTRRYFYGWLTAQSVLVGGQLGIALTTDDDAMRGSYFIGSGVATAGIGLLLLGKRPGMRAVSRYREMPSSSATEKQAKLAAGEAALAGQAEADRKGGSWVRHLLGASVALGSGAAVALMYEHSLKLAAQRVFATFFVSELQIATRPGRAIRNHASYLEGRTPNVAFSFAPMLDWHTQGVSMNARF
jgi:hypothetical protein